MRFFEVTSTIAAGPDAIWPVLTDSAGWSQWDSGVDVVDGTIEPGAKIKLKFHAAPGQTFPVKVTQFDPPRRLCFTGGMPLGLFKGVRTYSLTPQADGTTTFHMREEFTGPLLGLIWKSIPDLNPSFRQFAEGLKRRVESRG